MNGYVTIATVNFKKSTHSEKTKTMSINDYELKKK